MTTKYNIVTISPLYLLGIAFVVLKLTNVINWSWWWVTLPFWGVPAFFLGVAAIALLIAGILMLIPFSKPATRNRKRNSNSLYKD